MRPALPSLLTVLLVAACQEAETDLVVDTDGPAAVDRAPSVRRLPNRELGNALHDLLGVDASLAQGLPSDALTFGFDNVPAVLGTSDVYLERWTRVIEDAVWEVTLPHRLDREWRGDDPEIETARLVPDGGGWLLQPGASLRAAVWAPTAGTYTFDQRVRPYEGLGGQGRQAFGIEVNGVGLGPETPVTIVEDGTWRRLQVDVELVRGWNEILVFRPETRDTDVILYSVGLTGPSTPSTNVLRERLMRCEPDAGDDADVWQECADRILVPLARRAWRRELEPDEVGALRADILRVRDGQGTFEEAMRAGLTRVLASPWFLFRVEAGDGAGQLTQAERAARLASLLWGSVPDQALLDAAGRGELTPDRLPAVLDTMLDDPRSERFIEGFAGQWLGFSRVGDVDLDPNVFPELTPTLREAMRAESAALVRRLLALDAPLTDLVTAPVQSTDPLLAAHYGLSSGATDPDRVGYLGEAAFSVLTAKPTRTSVTVRGAWILSNLLCAPPGMPPANVPQLPQAQTPQEAADLHASNPGCAACHQQTDPLGLALEHFDPLGRWRDAYADGSLVDASASLPDGTTFYGAGELAGVLAADPRLVDCATDKLVTYAFGRAPAASDASWLPEVRAKLAAEGGTLRALLEAVVTSPEFSALEVKP